MSAIFQRPLCDMGKAYDFSFRTFLGDPDPGTGGACDDRPHRVEMFAATAEPDAPGAEWRVFSLCPEHEDQLRRFDERLRAQGVATRFRSSERPLSSPPPGARSLR